MKTILLAATALVCLTTASNACTVPASSFFKNPNCVVIPDGAVSLTEGSSLFRVEGGQGRGEPGSLGMGTTDGKAPHSTQRAYALGTEPRRGTPNSWNTSEKEISRRIQRRVDGFWKSKTTLPGVTIDPVKKTRTITSVIVNYSNLVPDNKEGGGNREGNRGSYMGGSGRSHQGVN
jgi:hypothetical protein